jgi:hypothetical protein
MSRQLEAASEGRDDRSRQALVRAIEYELDDSLRAAGALMTGFSVRYEEYETLITLRAIVEGSPQICFVGAETMKGAILKCVREAKAGKLRWRSDKFTRLGD